VRIWDANSGENLFVLRGHDEGVTSVTFSPDGSRIASGSWDKTARVWDANSGESLLVLRGHDEGVISVAFSPDGSRVASGSSDKTVRVWDTRSGESLLVLRGHDQGVPSVAFSPDASRIVSGSYDNTARVWDANGGESLLVLRGHDEGVTSVAFSPDGSRIASGSSDRTVRVWETDASVVHDSHRYAVEIASVLVASLLQRLILADAAVAAIRSDRALSDDVRATAIRLAMVQGDDPDQLNYAAWQVLSGGSESSEAYSKALLMAEAACRSKPHDNGLLNTLGVAQYRTGMYAEAIATLLSSDQEAWMHTSALAFCAMAHHRLGHETEARAALAELRAMAQQDQWKGNKVVAKFLGEAEAMIGDAGADHPQEKRR
jgi:WD40 repeat protein